MKSYLKIFAAVVAVSTLAVSAQGQTLVGVQIPGYYGGPSGPLNGGGGNGYTAGVIPQEYWNVANAATGGGDGVVSGAITNSNLIYSNNTPAPTTLLTSTGGTSSATFSVTNATIERNNSNNASFPSPIWYSPGGLTDSYLVGGGAFSIGSPTTLSLSNLNATHDYNLIAYVDTDYYFYSGETVGVNLGSTTYYLTEAGANTLTGWTPSSDTNAGTAPLANYVEFTGILGSTLAAENLTVTGSGSGLSGFQLQDLGAPAPTPEPSSVWLMLIGMLGLGFHFRRTRLAKV